MRSVRKTAYFTHGVMKNIFIAEEETSIENCSYLSRTHIDYVCSMVPQRHLRVHENARERMLSLPLNLNRFY